MHFNWRYAALVLLAVIVASGLALQRQANQEVQGEIELLRDQDREAGRLRAARQRLLAAPVSAVEVDRLRADHAAVIRLRDEIDALRARVKSMEASEGK